MTREVMMRVAVVLLVGYTAPAPAIEVPGPEQQQPIAIVGGTVHVGDGSVLEQATVLFAEGRIVAVGQEVVLPDNTERVDATGKHVYPSLIASDSGMGLVEIDAVRATLDHREVGTLNPNASAVAAFNPDSEVLPVTRANGVLLALSVPRGPFVAGRSALMMLDGWNADDMAVIKHVGIHVYWPRTAQAGDDDSRAGNRRITTLREMLDDARAYQKALQADDNTPHNLRLHALLPLLQREIPLFVHADEASQIQTAVAFAAGEHLRMVLVGGYDAPYCAALLKQADVPVIVTAVQRLPQRRHDPYDNPFTLPRRLRDAGVTFCINGAGKFQAANTRNLPYHAGMAAAHGLEPEEAVRAITLSAAEILGAADRVGSLQAGKDATLFVADGDILEIATHVEQAWVQGRAVDLNNRHKRLWKKFEQRYSDK